MSPKKSVEYAQYSSIWQQIAQALCKLYLLAK